MHSLTPRHLHLSSSFSGMVDPSYSLPLSNGESKYRKRSVPDIKYIIIFALLSIVSLYYFFPSTSFFTPSCPIPPLISIPPLLPVSSSTNVLITGGAGYIGSHMTLLLLQQKEVYNIVIIDDLSRGDIRNIETLRSLALTFKRNLIFIQSDIGDDMIVYNALKQNNIDVVIHFAGFAYASESVKHPLRYFNNIVTKTQSLLASMDRAGIKRLVYSSSSATYGSITNEQCDLPLKEFSPQQPSSPYGMSKLMAEHVIDAYAKSKHIANHDFSYALLRYFNVIGADPLSRIGPLPKRELSKYGRIVDGCFDAAIDKHPMIVYGNDYNTPDGSAIRDYIHVVDLVDAHLKVLSVVHDRLTVSYNVGIGRGFSCIDVHRACRDATGIDIDIKFEQRRLGDPAIVMGDAARIKHELGWVPRHTDLTESLKTAWKWRMKVENGGLPHPPLVGGQEAEQSKP